MFIYSSLFLFFTLFLIGISGIFMARRNVITILMSIEIMLFAVTLNLVVFSIYYNDMIGQILAISILTVAAAESAIGLAILVVRYRIEGIIATDFISSLKG